MTDLPARINSSAICVPIYPAPPVMSHVSCVIGGSLRVEVPAGSA